VSVVEENIRKTALPKFVGPLAGTILPWDMSDDRLKEGGKTHIRPALEDDGLMARTFAIGECTYSLSTLIWVCRQKVVESFMA